VRKSGASHFDRGERDALTFADALYWSFVTATPVGYGDVVPQTAGGRVLAVFDGLLGMSGTGVIAGSIRGSLTPRQPP
jgi:voltage-gated potassium channel